MGCASSKLDDLQAVKLCRERCAFLEEATHQRYLLSEAHVAYIQSLKGVGLSLHRFFGQDVGHFTGGPPSPLVKLPENKKGDAQPPGVHHSHSNSGSHLQFNSDSEDDESVSESLHHHLDDSPPVQHPYDHLSYPDHETLGSYQGGYMNMNYMRNKATTSVVHEHRPMSPENVRMAEYSYPYSDQNPAYNSYSNYGGYFGNSYGYGQGQPPVPVQVPASSVASTSKQQAPPPPPPSSRGSAWEFLNPFEISEQYYPQYTPSRNSKDLREEEGIPDLEEEDYMPEIVKEVQEDKKFVDVGGSNYSKAVAGDEDGQSKGNDSDSIYHGRLSSSTEGDAVEYEVHMVDKKVVNKEDTSGDRTNVAPFKARGGFRDDSEVVKEIQIQFERASDSVNDLANILEVGKHPHSRKHKVYQASSKMFNVITPSLSVVSSQPSTSKSVEPPSIEMADPAHLDIDGDLGMRSRNLSSTLQELFLWEKKLYEEVKVEEKMRILHERKCRKLKHLDERGADFHKVDATRSLVRSLSTKIRIAIQVVDKISVKINKLRDEKLWPQLNEFIKGLSKMWKSMLECHKSQCQAIGEAKRLDFVASGKHLSEARLEATSQLERELIKWTSRFFYWVSAQKGFVRALNGWLLKCLLYVPEETPDGIVPFSPGRIGAPPVFIICNQWSQALERISEKDVLDSMRGFQTCVYQLWERDKLEMRQRMMVSKDTERKVKDLEREDQKIHKEIQALDKQLILTFGASETEPVVYQRDTSKNNSLQVNLLHIFEAMERFAASSLKSYEELLQRIEEDRLAP